MLAARYRQVNKFWVGARQSFRGSASYNSRLLPARKSVLLPPVLRWFIYPLAALAGSLLIGAALALIVVLLAYPQLPSLDILTDYRPKIPLRVYSADGHLIGEFGEERRSVVPIAQVPDSLKQAIIAAEDEEAEMAAMAQGGPAAGQQGQPMRGTAMVPVPGDGVRLPQTIKPAKMPAAPQVQAEQSHLAELSRIQQDLVRRRRRTGMLMVLRLIFFVALPTLLAGIYYYNIATPLYATKTEFVIQQADPASSSGGSSGGLFGGRGGAAGMMQDPIIVQSYLQSRDVMLRLDEAVNFRAMFSDPTIDPIQRLEANPSDEATYKAYLRNVRIAFDPTEGVVKMEVIAPSPEASVTMSKALIGYAEERVDQLTLRVREDQMKGARENYQDAEEGVKDAQRKVVELQRRYNVLSSEAEVDMVTSQIASLEAQLTKDRLGLAQMESNPNPNVARMEPLKRRIATMESQIAEMRTRLTKEDVNGNESLAEVQSEMLLAEADVKTRQEILSKALEAMESARIAANQQVRYLSVGVPPIPPDEPTYPRAFENTSVAFLIFAGIYLMISMTAAILREQITA